MLITQAEWARRHGFSRQYVSRLVVRGAVRLVDGKIDPAQADAALAALRQPAKPLRRSGQPSPAASPPPAHQRIAGRGDRPTTGKPLPDGAMTLPAAPSGDLPTLLLKTRIKSEAERKRGVSPSTQGAAEHRHQIRFKAAARCVRVAKVSCDIWRSWRGNLSRFHASQTPGRRTKRDGRRPHGRDRPSVVAVTRPCNGRRRSGSAHETGTRAADPVDWVAPQRRSPDPDSCRARGWMLPILVRRRTRPSYRDEGAV